MANKDGFLLSTRDYPRVQDMLRWWERNHRSLVAPSRRKPISTSSSGGAWWFLLTNVSASPMTGLHKVFDGTNWVDGGIGEVSIYPHPASGIESYQSSYVAASRSGGRWFALEVTNIGPSICEGDGGGSSGGS